MKELRNKGMKELRNSQEFIETVQFLQVPSVPVSSFYFLTLSSCHPSTSLRINLVVLSPISVSPSSLNSKS